MVSFKKNEPLRILCLSTVGDEVMTICMSAMRRDCYNTNSINYATFGMHYYAGRHKLRKEFSYCFKFFIFLNFFLKNIGERLDYCLHSLFEAASVCLWKALFAIRLNKLVVLEKLLWAKPDKTTVKLNSLLIKHSNFTFRFHRQCSAESSSTRFILRDDGDLIKSAWLQQFKRSVVSITVEILRHPPVVTLLSFFVPG